MAKLYNFFIRRYFFCEFLSDMELKFQYQLKI